MQLHPTFNHTQTITPPKWSPKQPQPYPTYKSPKRTSPKHHPSTTQRDPQPSGIAGAKWAPGEAVYI